MDQRLGKDQPLAVVLDRHVRNLGMDRDGRVRQQRPRRRRPHEQRRVLLVREREAHVDAGIGHRLVSHGDLVIGQRRAAPRAVGDDFEVLVQQTLVVDLLQRPPDALDVVVRHRLVRVAEVGPVGDPLGEALPVGHVAQDALAAPRVELLDAVGLDVALGLQAELLLDLELDRKAVAVPASAAGNRVAAHRLVARIDVLEDPGEDVVDAGPAVRRRRSFVDHVFIRPLASRDGTGEHVLVAPSLEDLSLERGHIDLRSNRAEDGHARNDIGLWGAPRSIRETSADVVEDGSDGPVLRMRVRPRSSRRGVLGISAGMLSVGVGPRPKGARPPRRRLRPLPRGWA